jgi:hypothetical protein
MDGARQGTARHVSAFSRWPTTIFCCEYRECYYASSLAENAVGWKLLLSSLVGNHLHRNDNIRSYWTEHDISKATVEHYSKSHTE